MGDKRHRADEIIHSVQQLPDSKIRGFSSVQLGEKILTTFIRDELPLDADLLILVTYVNGPTLRVDTSGLVGDAEIKITASAAFGGKKCPEKQLPIKLLKNELNPKLENKALKDNYADFAPGKWVDLEKYVVTQGPLADLTLKADKAEDSMLLNNLEIQSRKLTLYEMNESASDNEQIDVQFADNFMFSIHGTKSVFICFQCSQVNPNGVASLVYSIPD